jgi:6-phosphogluconate dehydrogenase
VSRQNKKYEIGMVGLGVMGRNLLLNMADHEYSVAGYDKDAGRVEQLQKEAEHRDIRGCKDKNEFLNVLRTPRAIMMLVPAGPIVDSVIRDLLPHLSKGDLLIDAGNSHFTDTETRQKALTKKGIHFFGMGVSGGEAGARHGPSMMPGGPEEAYDRIRPVLEATAAHVNGDPCVTHLGPGSAGHYVKMVHNGIEYGIMQLIAETYDIMERGLGLSDDELHEVYNKWNQAELNGYLMEITANIFLKKDEKTGKRLVDVILDAAHQKGTGMWTSQDAMTLQVPIPTTDMAVVMRNLSAMEEERRAASKKLTGPPAKIEADRNAVIGQLKNALYTAMILAYSQGMSLLRHASEQYKYGLDFEAVARIWRGGCIIRAALLEKIRAAFRSNPDLPSLLMDSHLGKEVVSRQHDLRKAVQIGAQAGIPVPAMMASLAYFDGYRSERLPANLIQAQRDYFGAHTYERVDMRGVFHTQWSEE